MTDRSLSGEALHFKLSDEVDRTMDESILARSGRNARTLTKEGTLRLTLITLAPKGGIPEHNAEGPITVHVVRGSMDCMVVGTRYTLNEGDVLSLPAQAPHAVSSEEGASFLLTLVQPL